MTAEVVLKLTAEDSAGRIRERASVGRQLRLWATSRLTAQLSRDDVKFLQ